MSSDDEYPKRDLSTLLSDEETYSEKRRNSVVLRSTLSESLLAFRFPSSQPIFVNSVHAMASNDVDMMDFAKKKDPFGDFDTTVCLRNILDMAISSKHYTSRDKHEIAGQRHWWGGISFLEEHSTDTDKKPIPQIVANVKAARRQMTLYYLVGMYGWEGALRSIAAKESADNHMPEFVPAPPRPQIVYQSAPYSRRSSNTSRASKPKWKPRGK